MQGGDALPQTCSNSYSTSPPPRLVHVAAATAVEARFPFLWRSFRLAETFVVDGYRTIVHMVRSFGKARRWMEAVITVCRQHGIEAPSVTRWGPWGGVCVCGASGVCC
jgi:hypothetical protein